VTRVAFYDDPVFGEHEAGPGHPERPERLEAVRRGLREGGLVDGLVPLASREATRAELLRVHTPAHVDRLAAAEGKRVRFDPDTAMGPRSYRAAVRAAGAVVDAVERVLDGSLQRAFCSVRPPGHHATPDRAMGFCLLNNVALGAAAALARGLARVAVIDFDVHHGNGTEDILSGDERVLMASFFQHPFYPYCGTENPAKNMVNVPLPAGTRGDRVREVVEQTWLPRLEAFEPEMIFISAGFDAHREDDLGQMGLVESDYVFITQRLVELAARHAGDRIVSTLEGGYNLSALARSVAAHVRTLARL
jgi:acetoin utilization deacetylase AcuC-like enzyme